MSQTSYSDTPAVALPGMPYDISRGTERSALNNSGATVPFGVGVKQGGTTDDAAVPPTAAGDTIIGISVRAYNQDNFGLGNTTTGIQNGDRFSIMQKGKIYVAVEEAVSAGDQPYCRFASSVNTPSLTQKGSFRKSADGVAQVSTGTPTAAQNSTIFLIRVDFDGKAAGTKRESYTFEYISDGSMTATEVVTGFKTVMAADAAFSARVVVTGTATLILTGQNAGEAFTATSEGDGALTWAATTPAAATASAVRGARYETGAIANGLACLSFDANTANI